MEHRKLLSPRFSFDPGSQCQYQRELVRFDQTSGYVHGYVLIEIRLEQLHPVGLAERLRHLHKERVPGDFVVPGFAYAVEVVREVVSVEGELPAVEARVTRLARPRPFFRCSARPAPS
jgi:hypothetical protein